MDPDTHTDVLCTDEHVQWAMQLIGHTFDLPVSYIDVMHISVDLYSSW